jgi:hypothetical protein
LRAPTIEGPYDESDSDERHEGDDDDGDFSGGELRHIHGRLLKRDRLRSKTFGVPAQFLGAWGKSHWLKWPRVQLSWSG